MSRRREKAVLSKVYWSFLEILVLLCALKSPEDNAEHAILCHHDKLSSGTINFTLKATFHFCRNLCKQLKTYTLYIELNECLVLPK